MRSFARNGLTALGAAAGYVACAAVGTVLSVPPDGFAIVWPATAFLIGLMLLLPPREWWWLVAAVVPTHFLIAAVLQPDAPLAVVATQVGGNFALAVATVVALRKTIGKDPRFDTFVSVLKFMLVAGFAVPAVVNAAVLAVHFATGWTDDLWLSWRQWMVAGFVPTMTIVPLFVLAAKGGLAGRPNAPLHLRIELTLLAIALFALGVFAFDGIIDVEYGSAPFLAPLPLLLWAAVRTGVGGTALALLAFTAGLLVPALRHLGPFAPGTPLEDVVALQIFLVTRAAIVLLLAALMDERRHTADLLRRFEAAIQVAASSTDTGLWQWDALAPRLWLTKNCRAMFGLSDDDTNTPYDFLDAVHPEDAAIVGMALEKALTGGEQMPVLEFRLCSGGKTRWFVLQSRTACDEAGHPTSVSGVFRDISERIESRLEVERLEERLASLQDDERRRIAHELHDSTAQHLVAAKFMLLTLHKQVPEHLRDYVDDAYRSLGEATAEIRTFTYLLHSSQLEDEGLNAMLRRYVPGFERRTGVGTALRVAERADELPGDLQHALLRITQESLGNIQRHSGATRAAVDVRCVGGAVHLVVCDNGKGMGAEERERLGERLRLGLGIHDMTVRVRSTCCANCGDCRGSGTAIHVAVPLQAPVPASARGIANIARETLRAGRG
jgi:PAS domain S-box-containing protein